MAKPTKILAKVMHLYSGLELIGSKTSVHAREAELEVTPVGCKMTSKKTGRTILVPYANIKGLELFAEAATE